MVLGPSPPPLTHSQEDETQNSRRNANRNARLSNFRSLFEWAVWEETCYDHRWFRFAFRWPFRVSSFRERVVVGFFFCLCVCVPVSCVCVCACVCVCGVGVHIIDVYPYEHTCINARTQIWAQVHNSCVHAFTHGLCSCAHVFVCLYAHKCCVCVCIGVCVCV